MFGWVLLFVIFGSRGHLLYLVEGVHLGGRSRRPIFKFGEISGHLEPKTWGGVPLSGTHDIALSVLMWSGPTRFILVAPGARELPRQFTEPRGRENADNADLELPTDRGDLGLVQRTLRYLRNAPNCHQDPSPDRRNLGSGPEEPQAPQECSQLPPGPLAEGRPDSCPNGYRPSYPHELVGQEYVHKSFL